MKMPGKTPEELAGRLVVGLESTWPSPVEWSWLRQWRPFGVILFSRNVRDFSQLQQLCSVLKNAVPGLKIFADHEGGPVSQMAAAVGRPPVAYGLGVLDDADLTRRVHVESARRLKAAGLDWVLAPCADILSEKRNPVIGARSFGSDPELVARHVEAAVNGLREGGLSCCLKHWPGHGSSATDSHLESTVVKISPHDEIPFQAGIQAGAHGLMPGHLLTGEGQWPATLSREFLAETRRSLAIDRPEFLLIADDVSMGALREPMVRLGVDVPGAGQRSMVDVETISLEWFEHLAAAGCDIFLIRGLPFAAFPQIGEKTQPPAMDDSSAVSEYVFDEVVYNIPFNSASPAFTSGTDTLFSLDLARNDRWQVAGALGSDHWDQWDALWAERFNTVVNVFDLKNPLPGESSIAWLLVTNHRPMPENWETTIWAESLRNRIGFSGRCLVMGHPSLGDDLEDLLGPGWDVTSLYDVSCEMLELL